MTLEEFERLHKEADRPLAFGPGPNAAFRAAAYEMVPRMIKALKTVQRVTKSIDKVMATVGEEIIVMVNDVEFRIDFTSELKQAIAELEQP